MYPMVLKKKSFPTGEQGRDCGYNFLSGKPQVYPVPFLTAAQGRAVLGL